MQNIASTGGKINSIKVKTRRTDIGSRQCVVLLNWPLKTGVKIFCVWLETDILGLLWNQFS